jgi:hypothetical protein
VIKTDMERMLDAPLAGAPASDVESGARVGLEMPGLGAAEAA